MRLKAPLFVNIKPYKPEVRKASEDEETSGLRPINLLEIKIIVFVHSTQHAFQAALVY